MLWLCDGIIGSLWLLIEAVKGRRRSKLTTGRGREEKGEGGEGGGRFLLRRKARGGWKMALLCRGKDDESSLRGSRLSVTTI